MKILAFSDVINWNRYTKLLDETKPDIVALVGDLADDGFADYGIEAVDEYYSKHKFFRPQEINVGELYHKDDSFKEIYDIKKNEHVEKFYHFLQYSGRKYPTIVIRGNHDEEDYLVDRIAKIEGCQEISGKVTEINGLRFLGLSYDVTHNLILLKSILGKNKAKVDVVLVHGENLRLVSTLEPLIIIRGGYVSGKYLINNVASVWTSSNHHAIVNIDNEKVEILHSGPEIPIIFRYKWIKPYSNPDTVIKSIRQTRLT